MRRAQFVLIASVLLGISLIGPATSQAGTRTNTPASSRGSGSNAGSGTYPVTDNYRQWSLGSSGLSSVGWLIPARTLISTSYIANKSFSTTFIGGEIMVLPYNIPVGGELHLSFFMNGKLSGTFDYVFSTGDRSPSVSVIGRVNGDVANFSRGVLVFSAARTPLGTVTSVVPGTVLTLSVWVSSPIWVQVDPSALVHSFETSMNNYAAPPSISLQTNVISPHTLSVGFEADA